MNMNELKSWMDFYDQQGMGPREGSSGYGVFTPTKFDRKGMAADWAMQMMGGQGQQQAPDFFGGQQSPREQPAYVQPDKFQGQMPQRSLPGDPNRGGIQNYLAALMKGR